MLTEAQLQLIKTDIAANPELAAIPNTSDGAFAIAAYYAVTASPDFWVWKTHLTEVEITSQVSPSGTVWSWPAYIARTEAERSGWVRMFNSIYAINPSLPNVRQGLADIFSQQANNAPEQRAHLLAMSRRQANRGEKLLASGTGSTAAPATMSYEGTFTYQMIEKARNLA